MASAVPDISALTDEQQLALQQFTSVTDQDLNAAMPILQRCQWNAQIAITRFFDGDAETIDPAAEAALAPVPPPAQHSRRTESLVDGIPSRSTSRARRSSGVELAPRIVPVPESQLTQPLPFPLSIIFLPLSLTYSLCRRVLNAVGLLFPFLPRLLGRFWSGRASHPSRDASRRPLGPRDTAARFIREFEEEHGVLHGALPFYEGGYAQAFDVAKRDLQYLLIILLSPEHDDTSMFIRETLLSSEFTSFVNNPSNDILLWAGSVRDAEAYQVSSALHVTRFPYASLIVHTPSVSSTAMSKIATSTGPVTAQELISKLQAAMQNHSVELERVRSQRREQEATRNLRHEQESAYERSLAQDREKTRRRKEEEAAVEKAKREERERAERRANEARNLAQWRRWRARNIAPEPTTDVQDAVRISIRMPDAERVIRRFAADAPLEELYAFVECYTVLKEREMTTEKPVARPEAYEHAYRFRLVSPMPREVYDLDKGGGLRQRIGKSGNLIVEKIDGEDDEYEEDQAEEE